MGLFQQRPEEPTEWAGIPSDPAHPDTAAEHLDVAAPIRSGDGLFDDAGAVASIVIPVVPSDWTADPAEADPKG